MNNKTNLDPENVDTFNISEATDANAFEQLAEIIKNVEPSRNELFERLLKGEDVTRAR